jgi:hypothetical protein
MRWIVLPFDVCFNYIFCAKMPLSAAPVIRPRRHTRSVRFEGHARTDGLWGIEAHITDIKPDD